MSAHPMSTPWLLWEPMEKEPRSLERILYVDAEGEAWVGNHPEGFARGLWDECGGGASSRSPVAWAHIPIPERLP